jgi:hypothetical protein
LIVTFLYAGSSIQNASQQFVSCIRLSFANFAFFQPHKQKSNTVTSGDSNGSISVTIENQTHVDMSISLTTIDTITSQNIDPSS